MVTTNRRYKDRTYATHLLRRSFRRDGKVCKETVGNLSHLPDSLVDLIRRALRGETVLPATQSLKILRSRPHGHVATVLDTRSATATLGDCLGLGVFIFSCLGGIVLDRQ